MSTSSESTALARLTSFWLRLTNSLHTTSPRSTLVQVPNHDLEQSSATKLLRQLLDSSNEISSLRSSSRHCALSQVHPRRSACERNNAKNTSTTVSATTRALAIPELLQAILFHLDHVQVTFGGQLVHLPTLSLFPLRRVSRSWNAIINGSIYLQRSMCLSANSAPCITTEAHIDVDAAPFIWLIWSVTPAEETLTAAAEAAPALSMARATQATTRTQPAAARHEGRNLMGLPSILHCQIEEYTKLLKALGEPYHRPEASWRSMRASLSPHKNSNIQIRAGLFCTPPTFEILGDGWQLVECFIWNTKDGETLGGVFDAYQKLLEILEEMWQVTKDPAVAVQKQRDAVRRADAQITKVFEETLWVPSMSPPGIYASLQGRRRGSF